MGHGYRQLCALSPAQFLGPGGTSSRKASVRSRRRSPTTQLCFSSRAGAEGDTMVKMLLTAIIFSAPLAAVAANGQSESGYLAPELSTPTPGQLLDKDYLTSTGETVARPGVPQSS